ncbi:MAG: CAP domain-containing protein [Vitreoscilla sp.]
MHQLKVLFSLAAAATLVACGGGGDSSTSAAPAPVPAPSPSSAPPVGTNGTLQTSVSAGTYSDARRLNAFNQLNAVRGGAGAGLLAQSAALDTSATSHANYLSANGFSSADSAHDETAGLPDFTGANPFARMQAAGFGTYSFATEVIGDIGSSSSSSDCVGDLLDTVYHAVSMLSRVTNVGFGFGTGTAAGMCTIDMASSLADASRQVPPSGAIVAYPYDGSTVAHGTFHVSNETPRVSTTLLPNATAGTPIVVGFRNQDAVAGGSVTITQFSIANAAGTALPSVILGSPEVTGTGVNQDPGLHDDTDFAVLVPKTPLAAGTYTVTLHATISGGQALALTNWSFTVAAP